MIDALLARAATRFVFVVGKGGVGKTTTAGAVALAMADRLESTHLISTDPAHSLGDLFQQDFSSGTPHPSRCNDRLLIEEFSARDYADGFFTAFRAPLIDLIEHGTYLDKRDATGFVDLSIPGIDEIMSVLRLVELHDSAIARVVVDTAPTGHAMRLLESAQTIRSWVAAGRAMAEKAGVVATRLVGARVRLEAEALLDELEEKARRFDVGVLSQSTAIVVERAGDVVTAETERLIEYLSKRGVHVAARVAVSEGNAAEFVVSTFAHPIGCEGLRAWRAHLHAAPANATTEMSGAQKRAPAHAAEPWVRSLHSKMIFVSGKGGVGKSTCAAAIATALSHDRRVCIVSTDPAGSLSEVFAQAVGTDVVELGPGLYARQIDAAREFQYMREKYRDRVHDVLGRVGLADALQVDRNVIESLWDFAPPGIDELVAILEILDRAQDYDVLVVDTAPTGHFLRLLELPQIALDWVHSLLRLLVKYSAVGSLDALARDLLGFSRSLRQLQLNLTTPERTAVFVVTLNQPVIEAETARLIAAMQRARLAVAATILNRDQGSAISDRSQSKAANAPLIVAADEGREIVGLAALRSFVEQWDICDE